MAQLVPAQTSGVLLHPQGPVILRKQLSPKEWEELMPFIQMQYKQATLQTVMKSVEQQYGIALTRRQMTRKLKNWKIKKPPRRIEKKENHHRVSATDMSQLARSQRSKLEMGRSGRLQKCTSIQEADSTRGISQIRNHSSFIDDHTFIQDEIPSAFPSISIAAPKVANDFASSYGRIHLARETSASFGPPDTSLDVMEWEELEPDVEIIPRMIPEDAWPFNKRVSKGASGSLDLSQLFEFLDLETKDLPRIESLITSWDSSMHLNSTVEHSCITGTELSLISRGEDLPYFSADTRIVQNWKQYGQDYSSFPFKGGVVHIDFPSGHAMNPCPFNELYPFPVSAPRNTRAERESVAVTRSGKIKIELYEKELEQLKQACDETDPQFLEAMESLAELHFDHGEYSKAEQLYEKILAIFKKVGKQDKVRTFDRALDLVDCLVGQGRYSKAYEMHKSVHKDILATLAPEDMTTISSLQTQVNICEGLELSEKHEAACRQLVQITLNMYGTTHGRTKEALAHLGNYLRIRREYSESERVLATAVQLGNAYAYDAYWERCGNMISLALTFWKQDRLHEALRLLRTSTNMAESYLGGHDEETIDSYHWTGIILRDCNKLEESEMLLHKALGLRIQVNGESSRWTLHTMAELGCTLRKRRNLKEAIELLQQALPGLMRLVGPANYDTFNCCVDLAMCFEAQGHWDLALAQYKWLADEIRSAEGDDHPELEKVQGWIDEVKDEIAAMEELISYDDSESESLEEDDAASDNDLHSEEITDSEAGSLAEEDNTADGRSSKFNQDLSITEDFHMELDSDSQFQGIDMSTPKWP